MKPSKPISALKHKEAKRAHIPSAEEAGYEAGSPKVQGATGQREFPRNPVVHRGQDPELYWMHKYGPDDNADRTRVDIRSLYRHEHIAPETLIKNLARIVVEKNDKQDDLFSPAELFGNAISHEELDKVSDYYTHSDGWTNRLIQGDSLLVMTSLLEREGMAGQVQCIYIDPPYGIKYGSNWQIKLNNRTVKDSDDDSLSGEPEQIKAFRDTWELGIHSYLSYLRDRLLVAKELLHESGSCFVQISDENVHLVRCLMDEVFGSQNFVAQINFKSTSALGQKGLAQAYDYIIWYAKEIEQYKFRPLFKDRDIRDDKEWRFIDDASNPLGFRKISEEDFFALKNYNGVFRRSKLTSSGFTPSCIFEFELNGTICRPFGGKSWATNKEGIKTLIQNKRLVLLGGSPYFKQYYDDFPVMKYENSWSDQPSAQSREYVVETAEKFIQRCILMTTDPGDLVFDPTCGSGTTSFVAEQWARRWITCDTSRIALNIAKSRLMMATFPYYQLYDQQGCDLRQGFIYEKVAHIGLKNIATGEPAEQETLFDRPKKDTKRLRVSGPFTVETLQSYEPISPEELAKQRESDTGLAEFEDLIFEHLRSAGVKTGDKGENAVFTRVERLASPALHAEGWYNTSTGEKKAYLHIGPKFGTVSKQAVTQAIKECRDKRDADWLLILGFAFESGMTEMNRSFGNFQVTIVRMHDDLLQTGLLKKDKKAASFVTIGEPDIRLKRQNGTATVEIAGLDIYDPIKDEIKSRDVHDIAYWMLDDNYDGSNFVLRQVFFCGGDKDEFDQWKKGLSDLAKVKTKKAAEQTLKIEIDDEAFSRVYGHVSHPFEVKKGQKIAVRVVSQFGEETTKILEVK